MKAGATAPVRALPRAAGLVGAGMAGVRTRAASTSPGTRKGLGIALAAAALLGLLYYGWFRDSSFVRVEKVTVSGLTTTDAPRVRARLTEVAKRMSTLHIDEERLRRAIGPGVAVADLRITTDFPHGLKIHVVERPAVAVLIAPGGRVPVAADGTLLPRLKLRAGEVPTVVVGALPSRGRLGRGRALRLIGVATAAPIPLRRRVGRIRELPGKGLVAFLRDGPQVILGDAGRLAVKWSAAATVLADAESRGASYVDVRLPERPVAGGVEVPQPDPADQGVAPPAPAGQAPAAAGTAPAGQLVPGQDPALAAGTAPGQAAAGTAPGTAAGTAPGAAPTQAAPGVTNPQP